MPDTVPDGETPQTITLLAYNDDVYYKIILFLLILFC